MKRKKKALLLAFIFFILQLPLWSAPLADSLSLKGRIENLELMRDNLQYELQLHKQSLGQEVKDLERQSIVLFILTSVIASIGTVSILVALTKGISKAKAVLLLHAEGEIDVAVKTQLPRLTDESMKTHVAAEIQPLMELILAQKTREKILAKATVVIWAEDNDRANSALHDLVGVGFKCVSIGAPSESVMPNADLIVFMRQDPMPDAGWQTMSNSFLIKTLDRNKKVLDHVFLYYGPVNDALTTKVHPQLAFSNYQNTIVDRVFPLLSKRFSA